ncbi:hypothetical protein GCM10023189_24210 [Nibrella saemangeumensis]|uniref:histidine kinase n=1 Tax=Nibrella saemangeumensis TaxID=1084526 RepID=A0ABP8MTJ8_9BACT
MKRLSVFLFLWILSVSFTLGQNFDPAEIDSLKGLLAQARQDTSRVLLLVKLANAYSFFSPDSSMNLAQQALKLSHSSNFMKGEGQALGRMVNVSRIRGDLPQALAYAYKGLIIARTIHDPSEEGQRLNQIGLIYFDLGESRKALGYYNQARQIHEAISDKMRVAVVLTNMTNAYISLSLLDSARIVNKQAHQLLSQFPKNNALKCTNLNYSGRLAALIGYYAEAIGFYRQALRLSLLVNEIRIQSTTQLYMAEVFNQTHQRDSSLHYARLALGNSQKLNYKANVLKAGNLLSQLFKFIPNADSALYYQDIARAANDSLYGPKKFQQLQLLLLDEQQQQQELVATQEKFKNRVQIYTLLAGLVVVLLIAFILYLTNRQQQKANRLLLRQKEEINLQRHKAETALSDLRATQAQLIQREKMASLGELTAGIAHEIQNPLNFVTNLSEVSTELVEELEEETKAGHTEDVLALTADLKETLEKVNHHGKRADSIVKGMLQHSRVSSGQKEPTDLNTLADEYLRLAYQNLRAKDDSFTADLRLNLDPSLGKVNVAAQDIGRVLLNLYNNAFYAVQEKQKLTHNGRGTNAYKPQIEVITHRENGRVELRVKDNGAGIPPEILSKIYQPFFTTKPTGQGTGLGLSLSYDIVTKGHGGEMIVDSQENTYTEFVVTLPTSNLL